MQLAFFCLSAAFMFKCEYNFVLLAFYQLISQACKVNIVDVGVDGRDAVVLYWALLGPRSRLLQWQLMRC